MNCKTSFYGARSMGFSLSELLISLFLSALISAAVFQCYLANKKNFDETHRILERALEVQWVSDLLADSLRRSGFTPCLSIDQLDTVDRRVHPHSIQGVLIDNSAAPFIEVQRMSEYFAEQVRILDPLNLLLPATLKVHAQQNLILADCQHAEIHQIAAVTKLSQGIRVTLAESLWFDFSTQAYAGIWLEERWFIQQQHAKKPSLYYQQQHHEALSSYIHSLHIMEHLEQHRQVIDVIFGLDEMRQQHLSVMVRH